jgi:tripartite-type tricarboxylate transporter receptor subunit TctC
MKFHDKAGLTRRSLLTSALAAGAIAQAPTVLAQSTYPARPVKIIMTLPAGTTADTTARFVADALSRDLGQPVVVENRPGASSNIGYRTAAEANADGYTLLFGLLSLVMNPYLFSQPGYRLDDFVPLAHLLDVPFVLTVRADSPWQTSEELLAAAREQPGALKYPSYGPGSPNHVAMLQIFQASGATMTHVPYRDGGMTDLLSGALDCSLDVTATAVPHIKAGTLRALAVSTRERLAVLPDVPTFAEAGLGIPLYSWNGMFARAGTPPDVLDRLAGALQTTVSTPEFKALAEGFVQIPGGGTPEEFGAFIAQESENWGKIIRSENIRLD